MESEWEVKQGSPHPITLCLPKDAFSSSSQNPPFKSPHSSNFYRSMPSSRIYCFSFSFWFWFRSDFLGIVLIREFRSRSVRSNAEFVLGLWIVVSLTWFCWKVLIFFLFFYFYKCVLNMNSDTPLDYALFQLSPRRSRWGISCVLFLCGLKFGFLMDFWWKVEVFYF